ncbi:MAG: holo-ACP synthase [Deltaproteobacteria bacterium]|nr:holo-ACP synthase [Deltaproteobacteria bacterium]
MIAGVGVDLVEVARVKSALENAKTGDRFRSRVFTEKEIEYCEGKRQGKYQSYAGRFAAKEALMKALGRGWSSEVNWLDIEILAGPGGKPEVGLRNKTADLAQRLGIKQLSVSIAHTKSFAMAYLIAEQD